MGVCHPKDFLGDFDGKKKDYEKENGGHSRCHGGDVTGQEVNNSFEAAMRGLLVILALSLHAVFEGIALGLTVSVRSVWYLFLAIASHKFVIAFCVGMQFVTSGTRIHTFFYLK